MQTLCTSIRIEPDWNVKPLRSTPSRFVSLIRIEPDWNVKLEKGQELKMYILIRIEPDWNVKVAPAPTAAAAPN